MTSPRPSRSSRGPAPARGATWDRPAPGARPVSVTTSSRSTTRSATSRRRSDLRLDPERPADYLGVADRLNRAGYDVVSLQHEFGIYGGDDGERVLDLLEELEVPVVSTLHTVLRQPSDHQRRVLRDDRPRLAAGWSSCRMASARPWPIVYDVDPASESGSSPMACPTCRSSNPRRSSRSVGLAGRPTVLSFGLLGPGKGYELAIRAMSDVVDQAPAACYVILGATHPELRRREGEAYRHSFQALVGELGLEEHVRFVDAVRRPADTGPLAAGGRRLRDALSGRGTGGLGHARLRPRHRQGAGLDALRLRAGAAGRGPRPARPVR